MDKNSFTAKSLPQGGPQAAATRAAPSFLVDQSAANNRAAVPQPAKVAPGLLSGKTASTKAIPAMIQVQQAHDIIKQQELQEKQPDLNVPQLEDLDPALALLVKFINKMKYSTKYNDDHYEYRHVTLPRKETINIIRDHAVRIACAKLLREVWDGKLMKEEEWRAIGVQQSVGWVHYAHHRPEPNILLFRRPLAPQPAPNASSLSSKIEQIALV